MAPPKNTSARRRNRRKTNRKTVSGGDDPRRLREEADQLWEGVKRAAKVRYTMGRAAGVGEGGLIWVAGKDGGGGTNLEGDVVFHLRGEPGLGLTFRPDYQLEGEMSLEVGVQEYTDDNYLMTEGAVKTEMLCPPRHGLALSPHTGLLSFYHRVETTYHNAYNDPLENLVSGSANLLMKTGALESCFGGGGRRRPTAPGLSIPRKTRPKSFASFAAPSRDIPFASWPPGIGPGSPAPWAGVSTTRRPGSCRPKRIYASSSAARPGSPTS